MSDDIKSIQKILDKYSDAISKEAYKEQLGIMKKETKRLHKIILRSWDSYLSSYRPKTNGVLYNRTGETKSGIIIGQEPQLVNDRIQSSISIGHTAKGNQGGSQSINPYLNMSTGWQWSGKGGAYRYGYYEGYDQISHVIEEWERTNQHDWIELEWDGYDG